MIVAPEIIKSHKKKCQSKLIFQKFPNKPQKCPPRRVRLAMYGTDPRTTGAPPTIRPLRNPSLSAIRHGTDDTESNQNR